MNEAKQARFDRAVKIIAAIFKNDGFFEIASAGNAGDAVAGAIAGAMLGVERPIRNRRESQDTVATLDLDERELQIAIQAAKRGIYLADRALRIAFVHGVKHYGGRIPVALLNYMADSCLGAVKVNKPKDTAIRNDLIIWAMNRAVDETGICAYRNEVTVDALSACDAVSEVLANMGKKHRRGYESVRKIWLARGGSFRPSALWVET